MRTRPIADGSLADGSPVDGSPVDDEGAPLWFLGPDQRGRTRRAANIAIGASVPVFALAGMLRQPRPVAQSVGVVVIAVVVGIALRYRTRWPLAALAVALLGVVAAVPVDGPNPALIIAVEFAVFTVAIRRPRLEAVGAALIAAAVLLGVTRTEVVGSMTEARTFIVVVWTALALALGIAVRNQRAFVTALAARARQAEETREQETRTRVAEERVRIARELHDVVAHHIAVINVHAGLARRAIGRDADTVDSSLGHVQEAARTVLDELGAVLHVLRSSDAAEGTSGAPAEPAPGLDRLEPLLGTFAAAGLAVRTSVTGRPRAIDKTCDLAAFRIVQESLTNAAKHGAGGQAELSLVHGPEAITIDVTNLIHLDPAGATVGAGEHIGHGLVGMRERAAVCGGSLSARAGDDGVFRVHAVIPYRPAPRSGRRSV